MGTVSDAPAFSFQTQNRQILGDERAAVIQMFSALCFVLWRKMCHLQWKCKSARNAGRIAQKLKIDLVLRLRLPQPQEAARPLVDRDDFAQEIRSRLDLFWIGDGLMPFLVEDTEEIRNELVEEDFSDGGGADDHRHQLRSVGIACDRRPHGSAKPGRDQEGGLCAKLEPKTTVRDDNHH